MCDASPISGSGYIAGGRPALRMNPRYTRTSSASVPNQREAISDLLLRRAVMTSKRTAGDLATFLECRLQGDSALVLKGVASPEVAAADDLVYLDSNRHTERVTQSAARCVITAPELMIPGKTLILTPQPKLAF